MSELSKKYLGKSADLTLARLEQIAELLGAQSEIQLPPPQTLAKARADQEAAAVRPPVLAQQPHALPPLLATKLHVPRPRTHLVPRAHLVERLQGGAKRALTLVSAPAGFGKTTLLAQWLAACGMPVAWLSLEAEDNDPSRFLAYLIAALQTLDAQLGTTALALLRTPQPPLPEAVLAVLTNDLVQLGGGDFALVLDDYHAITADPIQGGMTFLLEHLPSHLHLIVATRADPPLPLARLRAQGQLTEVRTADLRFGSAEASAFLQAVMGLDLPAEAIATLEQRTEGWIAGLQLAGLSLQGRADVSAFLAAFSGSHRYVLDYLSDEVLARQSAPVQQFLLHTSILERLSGPLCDAVMGQEGSQAMLETLERANLFVVPLDEERGWYRYHHLFAEMLRSHQQQTEPMLSPLLHRRASAWYERHDLPAEAVHHALAVPDAELAARLIEAIALPIVIQGHIETVRGWMNALPDALVRARPLLCIQQASYLMHTNQLEAAKARLDDAERGIQEEIPAEQARTLRSYVLTVRGGVAALTGDLARAASLAYQALETLPEAEVMLRAAASVVAAHAYLVSGDVAPESERAVLAADAFIQSTGVLFAARRCMTLLARFYVLQGRLRKAATTYAQVVEGVPPAEVLYSTFTYLFYHFALGDLLREWNDLEAAERHLVQGLALVTETLTAEPFVVILGYTALARLQQVRGNTEEALVTLDALAHLAEQRHITPYLVTQVAAMRAQLELAQGNVAAAIHWADASGLSATDEELPYPREVEYLVLVRVRIAQGREDSEAPLLQHVLHLLDRLLQDAEAKARMHSVLEILMLRALALEAQGKRIAAFSALEQALVLAAPEGYIRLFVDEGEPMRAMLRQAKTHSAVAAYVTTLLAAFREQHTLDHPFTSAHPDSLVEPLTEREREVLGLLLQGASNREIARRLVLSVNTVKRHVYNLCGKLGVQSRTQAIIRARALNLL